MTRTAVEDEVDDLEHRREAWRELLPEIPPARDYVLIARPGLPEAMDARGVEWVRERVREIVRKAAA